MVFAGRIIVTTAYSCCLISPCRCSVQDKEEKKTVSVNRHVPLSGAAPLPEMR